MSRDLTRRKGTFELSKSSHTSSEANNRQRYTGGDFLGPITLIVGSLRPVRPRSTSRTANLPSATAPHPSSRATAYSLRQGSARCSLHHDRICGICGDNHATCATYAQNMAFGVRRLPWRVIVTWARLPSYIFDHKLFRPPVGVGFCEQWSRSQSHVLSKAPDASAAMRSFMDTAGISNQDRAQSFTGGSTGTSRIQPPPDREILPHGGSTCILPLSIRWCWDGTHRQLFTDYLVRRMKYVDS